MFTNTISNRAIVIGIRPENLGATDSQKASRVTQPSPLSSSISGKASSLSSHISAAFQGLMKHWEAPSFGIHRYEEDMRPAFTVGQNLPQIGFPKGVPQGSSQEQYQRQEKYQPVQDGQGERDAAAAAANSQDRDHDGKDDMPNPDSGDPGGPRSLDPFLYQPQPLYINAIAKSMIR